MDYSKTALKRASDLLKTNNLEFEELIEADFTGLLWGNCLFDAIISTQVLGHGKKETIKKLLLK
ncbi:MAG: class I SAM-dependent methyltransferase [Halanaerobiales bacterium]|nr:class I SAM-dependent methyltransferase [Halanaerobiales bacterium]